MERNTGSKPSASKVTDDTTLGEFVKANRLRLGMSQTELAKVVGRSRFWLAELERGTRYETGKAFKLDAPLAIKLARVLEINPYLLLELGEVPKKDWPDLSYTLSDGDTIRTIDITALTHEQSLIVG